LKEKSNILEYPAAPRGSHFGNRRPNLSQSKHDRQKLRAGYLTM